MSETTNLTPERLADLWAHHADDLRAGFWPPIVRAEYGELLDEIERLRRLLAELTDPDPCWFDHNGGCQAHGYLTLRPGETCPQYDAQQIRAALAGEQ